MGGDEAHWTAGPGARRSRPAREKASANSGVASAEATSPGPRMTPVTNCPQHGIGDHFHGRSEHFEPLRRVPGFGPNLNAGLGLRGQQPALLEAPYARRRRAAGIGVFESWHHDPRRPAPTGGTATRRPMTSNISDESTRVGDQKLSVTRPGASSASAESPPRT